MPIFAIEEATTEVSRERRGGKVSEIRTLEVHGNGGRNRARLMFGDCQQRPTVGYLTRDGAAGVTLVGWLPAAAFDGFRKALAAGGPLQMHYESRDGGLGYLRRIGVGRDGVPVAAAAWSGHDGAEEAEAPAATHAAFAMPL
jgi:hypothetical protein